MRKLIVTLATWAVVSAAPASAETSLPPGIWTNTEDEYFAEEEGRDKPDWLAVEVVEDGRWQRVDAFGEAQSEWQDGAIPGLSVRDGGGWQIAGSEIRRAREFSCWVSVRKFAGKPDGSKDWTFQNTIAIHDQGGRAFVPGHGVAPDVTIRLRSVTWAKGSRNAPSLVLYVHKDDPERAESYSWAGPDSERVGINLRWVQGSCAQDYQAQGATREALIAAGAEWKRLYENGAWDSMRDLYEADASLMAHNAPAQQGADTIVTFLQRLGNQGAKVDFRFEPEDVAAESPYGFVTAKYWMDITFPGRDPVQVAGRSLLVYKWRDGRWRLWRDMDNFTPDVPAVPSQQSE